mmetsp:Transcript_37222/g.75962  ORF Transcript_37222/g.75962 Transcript_37222/m.75962 type:complete len:768 (+) Transcript_37222:30-2333(+)
MPSSLMARAKAAQSSSSSQQSSSKAAASTAPKKKTSSLAAAARQTTNRGNSTSSNKSTFVPSYKLNPLNAAASTIKIDNRNVKDTAKITAAAGTADSSSKNDVLQNVKSATTSDPTTKSSSIIATTLPKEKTLMEQLLQCQNNNQQQPPPSRIYPAEYFMCTQSEALDRQTHMELSPLECYPSSLEGIATKISTVSTNDQDTALSSPQCSTKFSTANNNNSAARRIRPKHHAQYVIKKYRRSAAGGGTLSEISEGCIRTLEQLNGTVDYLIGDLFVWQMPPPIVGGGDDPNEISIWEEEEEGLHPVEQQQHTPFSLSDTVAFIDNRLRAVQKDLVTLLGNLDQDHHNVIVVVDNNAPPNNNSITMKRLHRKQLQLKQTVRKMQAKMIRYNILTSYLLSNVPSSKYEVKFGARALRTSLTCYLNLSSTLDDEYTDDAKNNVVTSQYKKECRMKDEIMAYMVLLHSSAVLRAEETALPPSSAGEVTSSLMEESGSGWGALLSTFCKHVVATGNLAVAGSGGGCNSCHQSLAEKYPRWKWALTLACLAQEGNFQGYLKLLKKGPSTVLSPSLTALTKEEEVDNARFLLLARCCASHSLNLIRLGQLRRYNHSFGKGEKVSGKDLARLLHFDDANDDSSAKLAIDFCRDAGLPIVEKECEESVELYVAMKSAPISVSKDGPIKRMCNPGRRNDCFVFGSCLDDTSSRRVDLLTDQLNGCGIQQSAEDWEDNVEADDAKSSCSSINAVTIEARIDDDGVAIPSSQVIRTLVE